MSTRTLTILRLVTTVSVVALLIPAFWVQALHAAYALTPSEVGGEQSGHTVDLTAQIIGMPAMAESGESFTYSVRFSKLGPDSADGATFTIDLGKDMSKAEANCASTSGRATCPTDLVLARGGGLWGHATHRSHCANFSEKNSSYPI